MSTTPIEVTTPSVSTPPEVKPSVDIEAILTKVLSTQAETFTNTLNSLTTKFDESVNNVISQTSDFISLIESQKSQNKMKRLYFRPLDTDLFKDKIKITEYKITQ